jgi:hypothetical protein
VPFSFNPEIHTPARFWPLRAHLCGHIELVEPEYGSYRLLFRPVTDFTNLTMLPNAELLAFLRAVHHAYQRFMV